MKEKGIGQGELKGGWLLQRWHLLLPPAPTVAYSTLL